jgi:TrmH family RNA methyltransferase
MVIDDIHHPSIQQFLALRDRSERDRRGLFLCEGLRFLIQGLASRAVERVYVTPALLGSGPATRYLNAARRSGIPVEAVSERMFRRMSLSTEPSGIGIVARQRWRDLPSPNSLHDGCWVSFDMVQSPGNFGTVLRTCDAAGASGTLLIGADVDPNDPGAVRGSMGSIFSQRLTRTSWEELRKWAGAARVLIVGTSPHANYDYREVSYRRPVVITMGCERRGLSEERLSECDAVVRIPMVGTADSLNVAVAASIILYEVYGQRKPAGKPRRLPLRGRHQ